MKYIDTHCHLNCEKMFDNWEEYLQKFIDIGGVSMINAWASEFYNLKAIEINKIAEDKYKSFIMKSNLWLHPLEVVEWNINKENVNEKMDWLRNLIEENKKYVAGIGECWIDLHYENTTEILEVQKNLFLMHCELARELNLPLVVHSRDWFEATIETLKDYTDLTVYFHCRWYGPEEYKKLRDMNFKKLYLGFCGNITYKKVDNLLDTLKLVSLDSLVLETDAPYLTPQIVRWEWNEPAFVAYIYDFVSDFLWIDEEQLTKQLEENFLNLIKLK